MQPNRVGVTLAACLAAIILTVGPGVRAEGLQAGLWRTIQPPPLNGVVGPPRESKRCLRAADVDDLDRTFSPVFGTTNSACERVAHELTPQRLRWHLQCRGQLDMDVAGEFVF